MFLAERVCPSRHFPKEPLLVLIGQTGSCDNAVPKGTKWDEEAKEAMDHRLRLSIERLNILEVR